MHEDMNQIFDVVVDLTMALPRVSMLLQQTLATPDNIALLSQTVSLAIKLYAFQTFQCLSA